jgi:cell division protein FtsW
MTKKPVDYPILFITILLVTVGVVMVFSASFYSAKQDPKIGDSYFFFKRQCLWAVIGFIAMAFMANLDYWKLEKFAKPFLIVSLGLLVAVLLVGVERNGAKRWLEVAGLSVQPSEIAKFSMIVFLASSLTKRREKLKKFFSGVLPYLLLLGVFFALIILQPNLSTAGSLAILTFIMLFVAGVSLWFFGLLIIGGGAVAAALIVTSDYRFGRYTAFLDPWSDPLDSGYQVIQSLYSLGSGGLFGMGLGQSRQKFLYIPYPETDFIFSIIGEELGFIGAVIIIFLFMTLIWRGLKVAITAPDLFGSLLAAGIISMIAIQTVINIAVVTASMPATGLPLPFISFGGSSLAFFLASVGVLLNISRYAKSS